MRVPRSSVISPGRQAVMRSVAGHAAILAALTLWLAWAPACNAASPVRTTGAQVGRYSKPHGQRSVRTSSKSAQRTADMQLLKQFAASELQHRRRRRLQQVKLPPSFRTLECIIIRVTNGRAPPRRLNPRRLAGLPLDVQLAGHVHVHR